ncbi:MAG: hypothetical protein K6E16_05625 [Lachnospiraceae bacterium]|nr:hypothetical protein [Lachnospiraceae bacterium]
MDRGFVTIATGKEQYYKIAANLLRSYKYHSADPMPFALICDRTNKYTDLFDRVIIMDDPSFSYADKLRLPEYIPFEENIFIDADCLAYKDLNDFWNVFNGADDFSAFGANLPLDSKNGWFRKEDTGIYQDHVQYIPEFIGGVYFLRKTAELQEFCETVKHIRSTYHDYTFRQFTDVADEPVYALAMSVFGFRTAADRSPDICFFPHHTFFESDIASGKVIYESRYLPERGRIPEAYMVHWGSGSTKGFLYSMEKYRLDRICAGKQLRTPGLKIAELRIKGKIFIRKRLRRLFGK